MHTPPTNPGKPTFDAASAAARRGWLATAAMVLGLGVGYGTGIVHFLRYLVPLRRSKKREMFIGTLADFPVGTSKTVRDPRGQEIAVTRIAATDATAGASAGGGVASNGPQVATASGPTSAPAITGASFRALSTKCPHLGCKAHWEEGAQRFRCPCHEGIFDKEGRAISGPPAAEGKNLGTYDVRVDARSGWVFVMVNEETRYGA